LTIGTGRSKKKDLSQLGTTIEVSSVTTGSETLDYSPLEDSLDDMSMLIGISSLKEWSMISWIVNALKVWDKRF
jgi:hypothetical protein